MKKVLSLLLVVFVLTCIIIIFVSCNDDNTTTTTITTTTPSIAENCKHDDPEKIVVVEAKNPTCQETGLTEGMKCLNCDTMVVPQVVVHKIPCRESNWIVDKEPTETESGNRHSECKMCGKVFKEEEITVWNNIKYVLQDDDTYCVTTIGEPNGSEIVIPSIYNGKLVTKIADYAFSNCTSLVRIVIPETVTYIGWSSFYYCPSLEYNEYDNAYYLGNENNPYLVLFKAKDTNITSCQIHDDAVIVADMAFYDCTALTSITISKSVTSIGAMVFGNCYSLKDVYYTGNIETWLGINLGSTTSHPMYYATNLYFDGELVTNITIPNGITNIGNNAFSGCDSLVSVTIPDSVTSIGDYAFRNCSSLTSIVIPDSVTSIGDDAFASCSSLVSVIIPQSVEEINSGAFSHCEKLIYIEVDENNENYKSIDGNLYTKDGKIMLQYAIGKNNTLFIIPDTVTTIQNEAFRLCDTLEVVVISDSVFSIEGNPFYGCTSLTTIYCESLSQPNNWDNNWNMQFWTVDAITYIPVIWGYTGN